MEKQMIKAALKQVPSVIAETYIAHENTILPIFNIISSGAAIGFAVKNSRFILDTIDAGKSALAKETDPDIRKKIYHSVIRDIGPKVITIVACYVASIASMLAYKKHTDKKIADLTTSVGLMTNAVTQYKIWKEEAEKELGKEKVQEISNQVLTKEVAQNPPTNNNTKGTSKNVLQNGEIMDGWFIWMDGGARNPNSKYYLSHHGPNDVRRWVIETNKDLDDGKYWEDDNSVNKNDFMEFLGEGIDDDYTDPACDSNKYFTWKKEDDEFHHRSDTVRIDISTGEGPDGRAVNKFTCDFFPYS